MVAVIIPTLNEERFIDACLQSILAQTYPLSQMDIMIVDGGSKDKTCSIVNEYHRHYDNIRLLHNPQRIQSIAFNIGVNNSSAPYIIRLDAHATYNDHYIELCIHYLETHLEYGNVGGICNILPQHASLQAEANAILNKVSFGIGGAAFRVGAKAGDVDSVPFGAFRRDIIEKVGGMREDLARGEDNEYNSRIRQAGYKVYFNPQIVSTYYARDTIGASMKQMYTNGVSIGKLLYIDTKSVGIRHLVPLCFVLTLVTLSILSCIYFSFLYMLCGVVGLYVFANIIATIAACHKYGYKYIIILPILFFLVHCSYGIGTFIGIIKG